LTTYKVPFRGSAIMAVGVLPSLIVRPALFAAVKIGVISPAPVSAGTFST